MTATFSFSGAQRVIFVAAFLCLGYASAFAGRIGCIPITSQSVTRTPKIILYCTSDDSILDDSEETLLRLRLSVKDGVDTDKALLAVQSYTQSFPFAVILPVQPMQYLPTLNGGVDVLFFRKKTQQKGSVDGGMKFYISANDDGAIHVIVKRNSQGQVVSKMFSEKLIVQSYMKAFAGEENDRIPAAPTDVVSVESVFHKWLDNQVTTDET